MKMSRSRKLRHESSQGHLSPGNRLHKSLGFCPLKGERRGGPRGGQVSQQQTPLQALRSACWPSEVVGLLSSSAGPQNFPGPLILWPLTNGAMVTHSNPFHTHRLHSRLGICYLHLCPRAGWEAGPSLRVADLCHLDVQVPKWKQGKGNGQKPEATKTGILLK